MPYVEGESLRDRLRRETQLPVEDALQIGAGGGRRAGLRPRARGVHRDIKPENILLSGGHALVADFGIARALGQAGSARLTETGMAVGTAAYMSPEQASGASQIDGRTDVYSLGCVVYEMLAGEPPYTGPTAQAIIAKRFTDPVPSVRRMRPAVPERLDHAMTKALAPVPADRFASAAEFARALRPEPTTETTTGPSGPRAAAGGGQRRRVPVVATALGARVPHRARRAVRLAAESSGGGDVRRAKVLAVLPFENLGDSSQAYFADGVGDEVRGKLSQLAGLAVIARASSNEYRRTSKPPQQIARELGAEYLLTGTVRWEKHPDGTSRVRVSPELVRVEPGAAPTTKWQQGFDAALTDVFQVQADIAGQVAQALERGARGQRQTRAGGEADAEPARVRCLPAGRGRLAGDEHLGPAESPARRLRRTSRRWRSIRPSLRRGRSSPGRSATLYLVGSDHPGRGGGGSPCGRAGAGAGSHPTRGAPGPGGVLQQCAAERPLPRATPKTAPRSPWLPGTPSCSGLWGGTNSTSAAGRRRAGTWSRLPGSIPARAQPPTSSGSCCSTPASIPRPSGPSITRSSSCRRICCCAWIGRRWRWRRATLPGAQAIINAAPKEVDPTELVAFVATYKDLMWVLDEAQQQLLLRLTPSAFDDDRASWGLVLAQTYALQGNRAKARVYADSARLALRAAASGIAPGRGSVTCCSGSRWPTWAARRRRYGRASAAWRSCRSAATPIVGPYLQHQLARIYLLVGEPEKALDQLEPLLKIPYYALARLAQDRPQLRPAAGNPRFERLVEGKIVSRPRHLDDQ